MGGKGSGRFPKDPQRICDDECFVLSLDRLTTQGLFEFGSLGLRLGNVIIGKIEYTPVESQVVVAVQLPDREKVVQWFETTCTPRWRGGPRRWLVCPICHSRAAKVFLPIRPQGRLHPDEFLCHRCRHLSYRSELTFDPLQRANLSLARLARRMGEPLSFLGEFPQRPKRMRRATYERHYAQYCTLRKEVNRIIVLDAVKRFPDLIARHRRA